MNRALCAAAAAGLLLVSCQQEPASPQIANVLPPPPPQARAHTGPAASFPALTGRVIDQAALLTIPQEVTLSERSAAIYRQTGDQFVIVTVSSLGGRPIEDYATALGRRWRISQGEGNRGVLLVVAPNERRTQINFGPGLSAAFASGAAQRIVDEDLVPAFRQSRWFDGIDAASRAITARLERQGTGAAR